MSGQEIDEAMRRDKLAQEADSELLAALKEALASVEWMAGATDADPEDHERLAVVKAAIAKASRDKPTHDQEKKPPIGTDIIERTEEIPVDPPYSTEGLMIEQIKATVLVVQQLELIAHALQLR